MRHLLATLIVLASAAPRAPKPLDTSALIRSIAAAELASALRGMHGRK